MLHRWVVNERADVERLVRGSNLFVDQTVEIRPPSLCRSSWTVDSRGTEPSCSTCPCVEADPLNDGAKDARGWLIAWLSEVPDISVQMCTALLGKDFESNSKYGAELSLQQPLSSAAFIIEQPDRADDQLAVAVAGVEGVLRAYEALLSKKPKARFPLLDAMREAKAKGTLERIVAGNMKACA